MRLLILAFVLAACSHSPPAPQPPQVVALPRNAAIEYARTISPDAQCIPIATSLPGQPDTAVCDVEQILAYCRVGVGAGSQCTAFADLRPKTGPMLEEAANVGADNLPVGSEPPPKAKPEPAKPKQKK